MKVNPDFDCDYIDLSDYEIKMKLLNCVKMKVNSVNYNK